jgi:hypothetical protein
MIKNKIVTGVVALSMMFSVVGAIAPAVHADTSTMTTTTTSMTTGSPYMFSSDLTIGSTGPDVVELQTVLVAKGYLTIPTGVSMGYFGTLTQAALASMQAAVGISPAAGYFGPITMAYFAAHPELTNGGSMMTTTPGCPTGAMYNSMTGASCTTGMTMPAGCTSAMGYSSTTGMPCTASSSMMTLPAGCSSTAGYSSTTGAMCSSNGATATNPGAEGTLTVTQGTPGSNGNIQQNVNVPVYGLQLQAQLGNVTVDRLDLDIHDQYLLNGSTVTENPGNFINNVQVWDGSTVLLNENVTQANFTTGTSSSDYYIRLSGINDVIPAGTTHDLSVVFTTSGSIDTQRVLTLHGYGSASLLAYSGAQNIDSYYDVSGISTTQTFSQPGTATVTLGADTNNPITMDNYIDPNAGAQQTTLLAFDTNTTQGSSTVNQVTVSYSSSGTAPTGLYLFQGGTQLSYEGVSANSGTTTFSNIPTSSEMSGSNVYYIKADFPSSAVNGTAASTTVSGVNYLSSNGTIQTVTGSVAGNTQYFNRATPQLAFQSASASANSLTQGASSTVTATFNFTLTPKPGDEIYPQASDFTVVARGSNGTNYAITSKGLTVSGNNVNQSSGILSANSTYNVTLSATANSTVLPASDTYTFYLTAASTTVKDYQANQVHVTQTMGLDNFHTAPVYYTRQ